MITLLAPSIADVHDPNPTRIRGGESSRSPAREPFVDGDGQSLEASARLAVVLRGEEPRIRIVVDRSVGDLRVRRAQGIADGMQCVFLVDVALRIAGVQVAAKKQVPVCL